MAAAIQDAAVNQVFIETPYKPVKVIGNKHSFHCGYIYLCVSDLDWENGFIILFCGDSEQPQ